MDARELLKSWPGWANAGAAKVLASPAWRLEPDYGGEPARMRRLETPPAVAFTLEVTFDGEKHSLVLAASPAFPDLWLLKDRLGDLPREVLLALAEKECGKLFQLLENVFRRQFSVKGITESAAVSLMWFVLELGDDSDAGRIEFALDVDAALEHELGMVANLDVAHEAIRSLTRPAAAEFGTLELTEAEAAALGAGDLLVVGEDFGKNAEWRYTKTEDELVHIVHPEPGNLTFEEIADEKLPPIPSTAVYSLVKNGKEIATASIATLGQTTALKIR